MSLSGFISPLEELVGKLPFNILDFEEVNRRFIEWKLSDGSELPEVLQIWVYVFAWEYLNERMPFVEDMTPQDVSILASGVLLSVNRNIHSIAHPRYFSNYSFRACNNSLISYIRKRQLFHRMEMENLSTDAAIELPPDDYPLDYEIMRSHLETALGKLSPIQESLVRRRFLDEISYDVLIEETGLSYGVMRNYVYRAMTILRRDPLLSAFMDDWTGE